MKIVLRVETGWCLKGRRVELDFIRKQPSQPHPLTRFSGIQYREKQVRCYVPAGLCLCYCLLSYHSAKKTTHAQDGAQRNNTLGAISDVHRSILVWTNKASSDYVTVGGSGDSSLAQLTDRGRLSPPTYVQ